MSLETEIGQLIKTINELNRKFELLLQRDVISAPQEQATIPNCKKKLNKHQKHFLPDEAKGQMTVKEFQNLCLSLIRSNAANKDIIKAIMLSNFDAHKTSDLADNQIALCAAMITEATKD